MGEMSSYMAAMSRIKDVQIDPQSGKTTGGTGKSLLEKAGVPSDKLPKELREEIKKNVQANKNGGQQTGSYCEAYMNMLGKGPVKQPVEEHQPEQPIEEQIEPTPQPTQPTAQSSSSTIPINDMVQVGRNPNEEAYMAEIIKNIKKRKY